jgi:hypothetical protein
MFDPICQAQTDFDYFLVNRFLSISIICCFAYLILQYLHLSAFCLSFVQVDSASLSTRLLLMSFLHLLKNGSSAHHYQKKKSPSVVLTDEKSRDRAESRRSLRSSSILLSRLFCLTFEFKAIIKTRTRLSETILTAKIAIDSFRLPFSLAPNSFADK